VITVHLRYEIDPYKLADFEEYGRRWIALVEKFGGDHHGYFLPSEGDSDEAFALFSFESLAAYEQYRVKAATDPESIAAYELAERTGCILRYERRFLRPLL
jgi:antibiotic biosynthesis monooxygenase (ABM) superfamily enzyme